MGHEWDDVTLKIQKSWLLGIHGTMNNGNEKTYMKTTNLLEIS